MKLFSFIIMLFCLALNFNTVQAKEGDIWKMGSAGEFSYRVDDWFGCDTRKLADHVVVYDTFFPDGGKAGSISGYITPNTVIRIMNSDMDPAKLRFLDGKRVCVYAKLKEMGQGECTHYIILTLHVYLLHEPAQFKNK